jgi:hypothetical protein
VAVSNGCCVVLTGGAGQGAHREVGSGGFEAKHRAVAEIGEPVGPIQVMPSLHYGTGLGSWAYKPRGEIVGDAVREVGVIRGTDEPRNNTSLGTAMVLWRRAMTQKASTWGRDHGGNGESDSGAE